MKNNKMLLSFKCGDTQVSDFAKNNIFKTDLQEQSKGKKLITYYGKYKEILDIKIECLTYNDFDVSEWVAYFTNTGDEDTPILSDILFTFFNKSMLKSVIEDAYYDPSLVTNDLVRHYFKVLSNKENLDSTIVAYSNWDDSNIAYELSSVEAPAYIFWGENDKWHPLEMLELYEDALSDVYSATFADCGHILHEERADEINKKLIEIFKTEI